MTNKLLWLEIKNGMWWIILVIVATHATKAF